MKIDLSLRVFSQMDGVKIAEWISQKDYETFFRNNALLPTLEECANYPAWSQNIVMMVVNNQTGEVIGMAVAYHMNYRNKTVKAGLLLEKKYQGHKNGHNAQILWIDFLFKRLGFRKVVVENVHEHFTEPYIKTGFFEEGRFKLECEINGQYVDEIRMGCFKEGWKGELE